MISPIQRLSIKEAAIINAFDELAIIKQTGKADKETLANVIMALYAYPNTLNVKPLKGEDVANTAVYAAMHLISLCIVRKAPKHAIWVIDETLGIALQIIQDCIYKTQIKCL